MSLIDNIIIKYRKCIFRFNRSLAQSHVRKIKHKCQQNRIIGERENTAKFKELIDKFYGRQDINIKLNKTREKHDV